jgi:hypothetical protein
MTTTHNPEEGDYEYRDTGFLDRYVEAASSFDWLDDAACADMNIKDFFQNAGGTPALKVLLTCLRCPVKDDCLESAAKLENAEEKIGKPISSRIAGHGIYAGLTPTQRSTVWAQRQENWARAADALLEANIDSAARVRRERDLKAREKRNEQKENEARFCFCGAPRYAEITNFCADHLQAALKLQTEQQKKSNQNGGVGRKVNGSDPITKKLKAEHKTKQAVKRRARKDTK